MSAVNPADYKENVVGQAVVSTMNLGASTADVNAMLNAAKSFQLNGGSSDSAVKANNQSFTTLMSGNDAWTSFNKTYGLSINDLKTNFTDHFNVQDIVDVHGLNVLRAVDISTNQQNVFVAGASFPVEFFGTGVMLTNVFGGDVIQGKALVDTFNRWATEGVNMNGAFASANSLGGSILSMAIPNLNVTLSGVVAFGGYGLNTEQFKLSNSQMLMKAGDLPSVFSDANSFSSFMDNVRAGRNMSGLNITNFVNGNDWVPISFTTDNPFGTLVFLQNSTSAYSAPFSWSWDGLEAAFTGVTVDHVLSGYWGSIKLPQNNPSQGGINYSVTTVGGVTTYNYSNGAVYKNNLTAGTQTWSVPDSSNPSHTTTWSTNVKSGVTTVTQSDSSKPLVSTVEPGYRTQFLDGKTIFTRLNANPQPTDTTMVYTVQSGDNLTVIAQKNSTTVTAIQAVNPQITNPGQILAGEKIFIPLVTVGDTVILRDSNNTSQVGMFNTYNMTTGDRIPSTVTNAIDIEHQIDVGFNAGQFSTAFYNDFTNYTATQLVTIAAPVSYVPYSDFGLNFNPIGAFYESVSPTNDAALSIASKTPTILGSNNLGLTIAQLNQRDTNLDGKLTGTELTGLNTWADLNENGSAETGETQSLNQAGITEIKSSDYRFVTQGNGQALAGVVATPSLNLTAPTLASPASNYRTLRDTDNSYLWVSGGYFGTIHWSANQVKINYNNKNSMIGTDGADNFDANYYALSRTQYNLNLDLLVNFMAGGGDDQMGGSARADNLWGGTGNDILFGYAGDDKLYGEEGDDQLQGGDGNDQLSGGDGNDRLFGNAMNDDAWRMAA